ncbi:hypothetical protein SAMN05421776_1309 [Nocardia farcinica]|jgi:hypothetical protein|uniref:Uncharacterized protein n=1 Tax=Nocardia farcinica TaxID=37329 RepID=A0A0H5PQG1_NOCFR|nr:hypothetical protein [Nocardia farcinica]AXK90047.1 hypothetical protein DXT66_30105 [Nocardia farcinica]MBF6235080.1 hypothetical protein [Nocardia farcinica]MBF6295559.1 hypothetical protein [Nocardia farcinica]PFW98437.1 hypothetical protein CJ469_06228 [Nocardia farcinica]PFX02081.1 hypothetical protein CJ468_06014 [Nocardia farcinica]
MAIKREGQWLTATRSAHVAYEVSEGVFRLSFVPERLVSAAQAVAGLQLAEIVAQWDQLLWVETPNTAMVWRLMAGQAQGLDLDVLDAVIRIEQSEWPTSATEWAAWLR